VRPVLLVLVLLVASGASAQTPGLRNQAPTQPATTSPPASFSGAGSSSGESPFLSGVPSGTVAAEPLALTIGEAIGRALRYNLGALNAEQGIDRARGARLRQLADLMPNIYGRLSESRQEVNLAAFGLPLGFLPAGVPALVGPFNVFDARVYLTQSILDLRALNETRAEAHNIAAAQLSYKRARDLVVLVSGDAYLQALAASARASSAGAQLQTADALYRQAGDLRQGGLIAGIDVLRAEVQLGTERQRVTAARNEFEKAKLRLARIIGLPIGQAFTLNDQLPSVPVPDVTLENALDRAYKTRPDYQAALERVLAAEAARRAIVDEGLPSVSVNADYGKIGLTPGDAHGTFTVAGALNVPIFQGGRSRGRLLEAEADLRARKSEAEDLKAAIYYDVRSVFLDLQATDEQLQVATRGRELAEQQLTQARDRFSAGVADNI
jgi:outer membrane protein TolC